MDIEKMRQAYEKDNEFLTSTTLNEYAPCLHKMLVKEKDFEKCYLSTKYRVEAKQIDDDFNKFSLYDLENYERDLNGSDTKL